MSQRDIHMGRQRKLTAGSGGLGVSEENNTGLAIIDKLLQRGLLAIVGLNLAAKTIKVHNIANLKLAASLLGLLRLRFLNLGLLLFLLLFFGFLLGLFLELLGLLRLVLLLCDLSSSLLHLGGLSSLCSSLSLDRRRGRSSRRLALTKFDRHDDM